VAGQSLSISYQEFPAPVLCSLWKHSIRYAGATEVQQIQNQTDIRKLAERVSQVRLALVYAPRLHTPASWAIQMATADEQGNSRPAIFCMGGPGEQEDAPGPVLALRGNPREHAALAEWLQVAESEFPDWNVVPLNLNIQTDPLVEAALSPCNRPWSGLDRLRDRQVLKGLLAGATVLRGLRQGGQDFGSPITNTEEYALVRRLLQTPMVVAADDAYDQLAADMVSRANVFLEIKYGTNQGTGNPFRDGNCGGNRAGQPGRDLITRREVADLGNVQSRLVRQLVECLLDQSDGQQRFRQMGLVRQPPAEDAWRRAGINNLTGYLRAWSSKQVRTCFERLRRAGMITAERKRANGPWQYRLPEELMGPFSVFRGLPRVPAVTAGVESP
jgi:hypothetical protein